MLGGSPNLMLYMNRVLRIILTNTCMHYVSHHLLNVTCRVDCVRVLSFSKSRVRNSVLRGVSRTVSYSFATCSTTKSSWNGLEGEREGETVLHIIQQCVITMTRVPP